MPKLSVVVVAYNSGSTLGTCLSSLPPDAEVIVIENPGNMDIHVADLPANTVYRRMPKNLGFGRACNEGLAIVTGDYALILNPDAAAESTSDVEQLTRFLAEVENVVAVGGRLILSDGTVQLSCARELTLWSVFLEQTLLEKFAKGYWIDTSALQTPMKVPQVTGACLAMKRVDGQFMRFDDRFFLYCEDTELMKRLSRHGDIYHLPPARFSHELGASSEGNRWFAVACYNRGKELYFDIHHGKVASVACFALNRLGAALRLLIWSAATVLTLGTVSRFRLNVATFARVLFAPIDIYRDRL